MTRRHRFLITASPMIGAMTVNERRMGRYMRDPDGHPDAPAAPAPTGAEGDAAAEAALDAEFSSGDVAPATSGADDGQPAGEGDPNAPPEDPSKKGKSAQERIDELTGSSREAERREAEANRNAQYWRDVAEGRQQKPGAPAPAPKAGERDPSAEPKAEDYDFGEADPKFVGDTARYHARAEAETIRQEGELRTQIGTMERNWNDKLGNEDTKSEFPDFDEKVTKSAAEGKWDCSPLMAFALKESAHGPAIAYQLASNPTEASRIAKLSNIEQAREFGILEGRRMGLIEGRAKPQAKTATDAPTPPGARARGAGGQFAPAADTDDFASFESMADGVLKKG